MSLSDAEKKRLKAGSDAILKAFTTAHVPQKRPPPHKRYALEHCCEVPAGYDDDWIGTLYPGAEEEDD